MVNQSSIPFNKALISESDVSLLRGAIELGHVSGNGPFTQQCEDLLQSIHNDSRVLLTTSCTHSLELAARLLNLSPGDEVIVPNFTFVSTASAFALVGATPVFVDVDEISLNIVAKLIELALTPQTRAVCIVHYAGISCDLDEIVVLCQRHNLVLIEDNAHGLGAKYKGRMLGTFGAMSTLSFHETKNITCGEGGALVLNDATLVERAEILREKGTNRSRFLRGQVDKYTWVDLGSSWVISDLLAALLLSQLSRLSEINTQRRAIFEEYLVELAGWSVANDVRLPVVPGFAEHVGHLFHLRFNSLKTRQRFIAHMASANISTVFHYQSLADSPAGKSLGRVSESLNVSRDAADTLVRLPIHLHLTPDDVRHTIDQVLKFGV